MHLAGNSNYILFYANGSEVFSCMVDMIKVFDTVKHSNLFGKLLYQGMPFIVVRYIYIYIYIYI